MTCLKCIHVLRKIIQPFSLSKGNQDCFCFFTRFRLLLIVLQQVFPLRLPVICTVQHVVKYSLSCCTVTLINPLKYLIHRKIRPGYLIHIFSSLVFMVDTDPLDRKYFLHIRYLSKPPLNLHFLNPFHLNLLGNLDKQHYNRQNNQHCNCKNEILIHSSHLICIIVLIHDNSFFLLCQ